MKPRNHTAGKPPKVSRRRSLADIYFGNMNKPDPNPGPPVDVASKLHPIVQSSPN